MKLSDKDIYFVIYTAVASLVVMGLMHMMAPRIPSKPPADPKMTSDTLARLVPLSALDLREKIAAREPTLLFIYTSWCPYCRQALPNLVGLKEKDILKNTHVLFVSLDKKKHDLAEYLARENYQDAFTPYIFKYSEHDLLIDMLQRKQSHFSGSIPYAVLFHKGKFVAETDSRGNWDALLSAVEALNK